MNSATPSSHPHSSAAADPLEQHDTWRAVWNFFNSDGVFLLAALAVLAGAAASLLLPQIPTVATSDPVAYSEWNKTARLATGPAYSWLIRVGLFRIWQSGWFNILLAILTSLAGLRLVDALARMRLGGLSEAVLRDELRLRVTSRAPTLTDMAARLRELRYRVLLSPAHDGAFTATRAPWAELLSALFHAGLVCALFGAFLDQRMGWSISNRLLAVNTPLALPGGATLSLTSTSEQGAKLLLGPGNETAEVSAGQTGSIGGLTVGMAGLAPGYRVSAQLADGRPLTLTLSNYASGRTEAQLIFPPGITDRTFSLPDVGIALRASTNATRTNGAAGSEGGQLAAWSISSGREITQTSILPSVSIKDVELQFKPSNGAVVDVRYRPGAIWLLVGLILTLMGAVGMALYPAQRLVLRHDGQWTEIYGSGRGARAIAQLLLAEPARSE